QRALAVAGGIAQLLNVARGHTAQAVIAGQVGEPPAPYIRAATSGSTVGRDPGLSGSLGPLDDLAVDFGLGLGVGADPGSLDPSIRVSGVGLAPTEDPALGVGTLACHGFSRAQVESWASSNRR